MARQSADHPRASVDSRLKRYAAIERARREAGSHPAAKAVHARARTWNAAARLTQFARIARGLTA